MWPRLSVIIERLARAGDCTCAGPLHAHHLGQKVLGDRQIIASEALHAKQRLAHPLVNILNRVTGNRLLHLCHEEWLGTQQDAFARA
jgi:hypothetical protein